jgi:hypothetical protein
VSGGRNRRIDYTSYLVSDVQRGLADVFFPTDFPRMAALYKSLAAAQQGSADVNVTKHAEFVDEYVGDDVRLTAVKSGYNPLRSTYTNMSCLRALTLPDAPPS